MIGVGSVVAREEKASQCITTQHEGEAGAKGRVLVRFTSRPGQEGLLSSDVLLALVEEVLPFYSRTMSESQLSESVLGCVSDKRKAWSSPR